MSSAQAAPRPPATIATRADAPRDRSAPWSSRGTGTLCLLFFLSGVAGLILQVVWMRELTARLGASLYAASAVLAAFMAGLALGATAAGRIVDRFRRPLAVYAVLELLIAACALALPAVWDRLAALDQRAWLALGEWPLALALARFAAVTAVLLVPTSLMGATLPCLARGASITGERAASRVGWLYAANTVGAVAGAFVCGFWLIEWLGVSGASRAAASLNGLAGVGALTLAWMSRRGPSSADRSVELQASKSAGAANEDAALAAEPQAGADTADPLARRVRVVYVAAFATGFAALAAEVLWSRSLAFVFDGLLRNSTYCFAAMLTVFLAGLAAGSAGAGLFVDRLRSPLWTYGTLLGCQAGALALSVLAVDWLRLRTGLVPPAGLSQAVGRMLWQSLLVIGLPAVLMGMAFPVSIRAASGGPVGRRVGGLYGINTLGCVAGAIAAPFLIVPLLGVLPGILSLAALLAGASAVVLVREGGSRGRWGTLAVAGALLVAATGVHATRGGSVVRLAPGETLIHREESAVATVTVIENDRAERRIEVDGVPVAGTSAMMQTDQKSLAHVPLALCPAPRAALTVGFGSGGASYSFLLHDDLERVDCVEICPAVVRAAPFLTAANHGFLERRDPRYRIIEDDARAYLRCTPQEYDVISTDCTDLRYKSSANLYDLEYFDLCRAKLAPRGLVAVWMPLGGLSERMFRVTLRTFHRVFPESAVFYMHNEWTHFVLLVGWRDRVAIDFRRVQAALAVPAVRADLAEIGLDSPYKLLATFLTAGRPLEALVRGDELNTQDRPILEFEGPRHLGLGPETIASNLEILRHVRTSALAYVTPGTITARERDALERHVAAVEPILAAQQLERTLDLEGAARQYLAALALTPEDEGLRRALEFRRFVPLAEQGNPTVWLLIGRSHHLQGDLERAAELYRRYFAESDELIEGRRSPVDPRLELDIRRQSDAWRPTAKVWINDCLTELARQKQQSGHAP